MKLKLKRLFGKCALTICSKRHNGKLSLVAMRMFVKLFNSL